MSDPIVFQAGGCPICGGDVMADESMEGGDFTDGEYAFCASNCGWFGSVAVEENGDAFPSTATELEPIVERLEQAKDHADKLADLLAQALSAVVWVAIQSGDRKLVEAIDAALAERKKR